MISSVYTLIDGSLIHELSFDTISNNLANMNTDGFKGDVIAFDEALTLKYVSQVDLNPGPVRYTGNPLDISIDTKGFFKVQTQKGVRYTRNGAFTLDVQGTLVTQNGDPVLGDGGPLKVEGKEVVIGANGEVIVDNASIGKISVVDFRKPQLVRKEGSSYFGYEGQEGDIFTPETFRVQQGFIEGSNVSPTEEMIRMIHAHRAFESAQKALQGVDEMTSRMVNDPGLIQ